MVLQLPEKGHQELRVLHSRFLDPIQTLFIAHFHQNHLNFLRFSETKVAPCSWNTMASPLECNKAECLTLVKRTISSKDTDRNNMTPVFCGTRRKGNTAITLSNLNWLNSTSKSPISDNSVLQSWVGLRHCPIVPSAGQKFLGISKSFWGPWAVF